MSEQPDLTDSEPLPAKTDPTHLPRRSNISEIERLERIERSLPDDEGPPTRPLRILNDKD